MVLRKLAQLLPNNSPLLRRNRNFLPPFRLETALARRRAIAARYHGRLAEAPGLRLLDIPEGQEPAWYHYTVFVEPPVDYNALATALRERHGIPTKQIYVPLHKEAVFRDLHTGSLAQSEAALDRSLALPLYVEMQDEEVDYVADALTRELRALL